MTHCWKPLHMQYDKVDICGHIPRKNHKLHTVSDTLSITEQWLVRQRGRAELTQQTLSSTYLCVKQHTGIFSLSYCCE